MAIDFTFDQEVEDARQMMRNFLHENVRKEFAALRAKKEATREDWGKLVRELRERAKAEGYWCPHGSRRTRLFNGHAVGWHDAAGAMGKDC